MLEQSPKPLPIEQWQDLWIRRAGQGLTPSQAKAFGLSTRNEKYLGLTPAKRARLEKDPGFKSLSWVKVGFQELAEDLRRRLSPSGDQWVDVVKVLPGFKGKTEVRETAWLYPDSKGTLWPLIVAGPGGFSFLTKQGAIDLVASVKATAAAGKPAEPAAVFTAATEPAGGALGRNTSLVAKWATWAKKQWEKHGDTAPWAAVAFAAWWRFRR